MDVTCERCGTEYEFDETLVSDRGTTVKCTNCGHLFKVFRGDTAAASADSKVWHVEAADGEQMTLGSLKELQRLIADGRLTQRDKISRGGEGWKRLGDIAELQSFFATAATQMDDSPPRRPRTDTKPGAGERSRARTAEATPSARATAAADGPRQKKSTIIGMGISGDHSLGVSAEITEPATPAPAREP
jgi:predicted Zn finger-like uncharacterized protein